ncbi:Uncharacterised protein [Mycobacteroides abscessus subsp. abscessus]|nr:Uncharacterised protein [Mycobacteroides abscessus subsp. abscessus]
MTTTSASAISAGCAAHRTVTPGSQASASISVELEIRGSRTAATLNHSWPIGSLVCPTCPEATTETESSASSHNWSSYGSTPYVGRPVSVASCSSPGSNKVGSPRNLLTIKPATSLWSAGSSTATEPNRCASTPPRSMSPTNTTGRPAARASPILAISVARKLISATEPAPSQITTSYSSRSVRRSSATTCRNSSRCSTYERALTFPVARPRTTSCEVRSLPGLRSTGLNRTEGSRPQARACRACALPISPPSTVTTELFDMF